MKKFIRKNFPKRLAGAILKFYLKHHKILHNRIVAYFGEIYFSGKHPINALSNRSQFLIDNLSSQDVVLDIACGTGSHLKNISKFISQGVGIDRNFELNRIAMLDLPTNVTILNGDIYSFDYVDLRRTHDFTVAIYSHILEHVLDVKGLIKNVDADRVLIIVPSQERWEVKLLKYFDLYYFSDYTHVREYTREMLESELVESGYAVKFIGFNADTDIICEATKLHIG